MTLKLREGGYYKTRDGRKVGPTYANWCDSECWPFRIGEGMWYRNDGSSCPGSVTRSRECDDLIAEWTDGPVRTVTRREVVVRTVTETTIYPGKYGKVTVLGRSGIRGRENEIELVMSGMHTSAELKAAAAVLLELAGALDSE